MKNILYAFVLLFFTFNGNAQISQSSVDPWTAYTGSHYGSAANNVPAWGGWVREYAKDRTGVALLDANNQPDSLRLDSLKNILLGLDPAYDALQLVGGMGSARNQQRLNDYMALIEADTAAAFKKIVQLQAALLTQLPDGEHRVYWQIGNEISSPAYSRTLRIWSGQDSASVGNGKWFDSFVIPLYAERYLAPSVEAIETASLEVFGEPERIRIACGSLTNATNPAAKIWLDSLLNYTLSGEFAPSLAGKKVYELVDIITVHYMMGVAMSDGWRPLMEDYWSDWVGTGRIKGIWSTEEVGINAANGGSGAASGCRTTARYLDWAIANNLDARQARTNYFAWNTGPMGTRVNDANTALFDFLGQSRLAKVDSTAFSGDNSNLETFGFLSEDKQKTVVFTFVKSVTPTSASSIGQIKLDNTVWGNVNAATVHYFSPTGHEVFTPLAGVAGDSTLLTLPNTLSLDRSMVALWLLDLTPGQVLTSCNNTDPWTLGTVTDLNMPCQTSGGLPGTTCKTLEVICPGLAPIQVEIRITEPAPGVAEKGTVVFGTGSSGTGFYGNSQDILSMFQELVNAGYRIVDRAWKGPQGWVTKEGGLRRQSCRYATLITWVHDNLHQSGNFCVSGNSGGSAEIGYALTTWNRDEIIDVAVPTSGPPIARLDYICQDVVSPEWQTWADTLLDFAQLSCQPDLLIGSANGVCKQCSDNPTLADLQFDGVMHAGAKVHYPNTCLHTLYGENDCGVSVPMGLTWSTQVTSAKTIQFVQNTPHVMSSTPEGRAAIRDAILNACNSVSADEPAVMPFLQLEQNHPNPFQSATNVYCFLPQDAEVEIVVLDIYGRTVATLAKGILPAGEHRFVFDAAGAPSGVYFIKLTAGGFSIIRKAICQK